MASYSTDCRKGENALMYAQPKDAESVVEGEHSAQSVKGGAGPVAHSLGPGALA